MKQWQQHYQREKSRLSYPDENLVRMLAGHMRENGRSLTAADIGCGAGRHIRLLREMGAERAVGIDSSPNALAAAGSFLGDSSCLVAGDNRALPLKSSSADIVIAWGSLHYCLKKDLPAMLEEIRRVLRPGGRLMATLRSSRDTLLCSGRDLGGNQRETDLPDIAGAVVSFFEKEEAEELFRIFGKTSIGYAERSLIGNTEAVISHWLISAVK